MGHKLAPRGVVRFWLKLHVLTSGLGREEGNFNCNCYLFLERKVRRLLPEDLEEALITCSSMFIVFLTFPIWPWCNLVLISNAVAVFGIEQF